MNLIEMLKGAIKKMLSPKTVEEILHINPSMSSEMKDSIELWNAMYQNKSPWLYDGETQTELKSLGLASIIASEKARTATIEMKVKITGDGERADFMRKTFEQVTRTIRKNLEYGIALGGLVVKPYVSKGINNKYVIKFSYAKATDFYPLTFSADGSLKEAAFVERVVTKEHIYSKIEYHKLEGTHLTVINTAYKSNNNGYQGQVVSGIQTELGKQIPLTDVDEWANIAPIVDIDNIDMLLFAYFKMPEANTVDINSPLGVSGFSRAVSNIRDADEIYSNLLWEFEGGQLAIDVDRTAFNPIIDDRGNVKYSLPKYQNRLFRHNLDLGEDDTYNVFNPQFREQSLINGLNTVLMHVEDLCSLSRGTLSEVVYTEARTATELKITKQCSYSANDEIQKELQKTFETLFKIMDRYCDLYNIVPSGDYEVAYTWDDSILVDKDTERQSDLLDIDKGLMSKVEYRMKWYGETEEQAQEMLKQISDEQTEAIERQQEVMINSMEKQAEIQNKQNNNTKETQQAKKEKANESGEIKK